MTFTHNLSKLGVGVVLYLNWISAYYLPFVPQSQSPGQYFLRPMMKEYKFDPASQMINVQEGTTEKISIKGSRVAFRYREDTILMTWLLDCLKAVTT